MTRPAPDPGRAGRDIQLRRTLGILIVAGLLGLVAGAVSLDEAGVSTAELFASWLEVGLFLPWLAALVLAVDALGNDGEKRVRRLRQAVLLAAGSFALEALAGLLSLASLDAPLPKGYRVALQASILSSCGLIAAMLLAARAFASARLPENRERGLARAMVAVAVGYGLGMLSAIYYAIAYANYSDSEVFVQGLKNQAFGALLVVVTGAWAASAFRRSAQMTATGAASFNRERVLFRAACLLVLAFVVICGGEVLIASGTTEIGYSRAAESARWVGVVAGLGYVAATVCAAIGFRRAARA